VRLNLKSLSDIDFMRNNDDRRSFVLDNQTWISADEFHNPYIVQLE